MQEKKNIEETKNEVKKLMKLIEDKEKKERRNKIVIRGLRKDRMDIKNMGTDFLEKEFGVGDKIKQVMREGKEGKEVIIIELEDWQTKEKIMREKSKLTRNTTFVSDADLVHFYICCRSRKSKRHLFFLSAKANI